MRWIRFYLFLFESIATSIFASFYIILYVALKLRISSFIYVNLIYSRLQSNGILIILCLCNKIWSFIKSEANEFNFWTFHILKSCRISIQLFSANKRSYFSLSKINLIVIVPPLSKISLKFPLNNLILLQLHFA